MTEGEISIRETMTFIDRLSNRDKRSGTLVVSRLSILSERQVKLLRGARKVVTMMARWPSKAKHAAMVEECAALLTALVESCMVGEDVAPDPSIKIIGDDFEVLERAVGYLAEYESRSALEANQDSRSKQETSANRGTYRGRT